MTDIVHIPGRSPEFSRRLVEEVPGFADSAEYRRLEEDERRTPGLVFSALAWFVLTAGEDQRRAASNVIEDAATSEDNELHNYIITEIFEPWDDAAPATKSVLLRALGPIGRDLYDRWLKIVVPQA